MQSINNMKIIVIVFLATTLGCTKQASDQLATRKAKGHPQIEAATSMSLTNNGDGSFSIDYGGATDVTWVFFRTGSELSISGNVVPLNTMSFYQNPVTTFQSRISGAFYQAVIVTGDPTVVNGWTETYTNVVQ